MGNIQIGNNRSNYGWGNIDQILQATSTPENVEDLVEWVWMESIDKENLTHKNKLNSVLLPISFPIGRCFR